MVLIYAVASWPIVGGIVAIVGSFLLRGVQQAAVQAAGRPATQP